MYEFTVPLTAQLNYLKYVLSKREDNTDESFSQPIFDGEMTAYEIGHHAISALWSNALRFDPGQTDALETIDLEKKETNLGEHLIELYTKSIARFDETVAKLDDESLAMTISSPVSGRDVVKKDFFWTTVMHSIHHMGQCFRLQGLIQRHK